MNIHLIHCMGTAQKGVWVKNYYLHSGFRSSRRATWSSYLDLIPSSNRSSTLSKTE